MVAGRQGATRRLGCGRQHRIHLHEPLEIASFSTIRIERTDTLAIWVAIGGVRAWPEKRSAWAAEALLLISGRWPFTATTKNPKFVAGLSTIAFMPGRMPHQEVQ